MLGVDLVHPAYAERAQRAHLAICAINASASRCSTSGSIEVSLAADMGGAGYIFTGDNDADVMHNSALINGSGIGVYALLLLTLRAAAVSDVLELIEDWRAAARTHRGGRGVTR